MTASSFRDCDTLHFFVKITVIRKEKEEVLTRNYKLMAKEFCQSGNSTKEVADDLGIRNEIVPLKARNC